jgi:hypothetical protein
MEISKIVRIRALIVLGVLSILIYGCDDEICPGFEAEPAFAVSSDSIELKIYASNLEEGDTISIEPQVFKFVPFDMNATQMEYKVYAPDYKGSLILDYSLKSQECDYYGTFLLVFDQLSVNETSTFLHFYTKDYYGNGYRGTRIDSVSNLADHFTPYGYGQGSTWQIKVP